MWIRVNKWRAYRWCRLSFTKHNLKHTKAWDERRIFMINLSAQAVAVDERQPSVCRLFLGTEIVFVKHKNVVAKGLRAHPVVVAPEVTSCVATRSIVHCERTTRAFSRQTFQINNFLSLINYSTSLFAQLKVNNWKCLSNSTFYTNSSSVGFFRRNQQEWKEIMNDSQKAFQIENWLHWSACLRFMAELLFIYGL